MKTVLIVLMMLIACSFLLKQSFRKLISVVIVAFLTSIFVWLVYPYVISQSKSQLQEWLMNKQVMLDVAVLIAVEVIIQIAFCIKAAALESKERYSKCEIAVYRLLRWYPGLAFFPVLFAMLSAVIFLFPGYGFGFLASLTAISVFAIILVGSFVIRKLLPEKIIRLELLFLVNVAIGVFSIIATVNGRTAVKGNAEVDWNAFTSVVIGMLSVFFIGLLFTMVKRYILKRKHC